MHQLLAKILRIILKTHQRITSPHARQFERAGTFTHNTYRSEKNEGKLTYTNNCMERNSFLFNAHIIGHGNCIVLVTLRRIKTFIPYAYRGIRRHHKTGLPEPPLITTMQRSIQMDSDGWNKYKKELNQKYLITNRKVHRTIKQELLVQK